MNKKQKKGIVFIIGGVLSFIFFPQIVYFLFDVGLYWLGEFLYPFIVPLKIIIAIALIVLGIKPFIGNFKEAREYMGENRATTDENIIDSEASNKVVHVNLHGGLIGLIGVKPNHALNLKIARENKNGWRVIQVIPSASGNLLLVILRIILLIITIGIYTRVDGYYVIMEKMENKST